MNECFEDFLPRFMSRVRLQEGCDNMAIDPEAIIDTDDMIDLTVEQGVEQGVLPPLPPNSDDGAESGALDADFWDVLLEFSDEDD